MISARESVNTRTPPGEQVEIYLPNLSMADLLSAIPPHCFDRSTLRSATYPIWDLFVIGSLWKLTTIVDTYAAGALPIIAHSLVSFALWSLYGLFSGLFGMGLWVVAHEAGSSFLFRRAFSTSKRINNLVGWVIHSSLGVPYHAWRISHAKHHAATGHMTQDQVFVPWTRAQIGLSPFDSTRDDILGATVSAAVQHEIWEAIGDSPMVTFMKCAFYLLAGLPSYLVFKAGGQASYPKATNHFSPGSRIFAPHQHSQIVLSNLGICLWLSLIALSCYYYSFATVLRVYLVPYTLYLWVNHWLVLITFLQHSDPLVPHYRAKMFTFQRGALCTLDRSLLGDLGPVMAWLRSHATHGISETHVLHHITSKIPHHHAWEATYALLKLRASILLGAQFLEDEGSVVFYKNARGVAAARPVFRDVTPGVQRDKSD
ncbi:oleoyl phosphatidylcholine desaturase [Mycena metata]|uniref:Oleoyl phosphatidylcholine desaturase n=1 Tax=Mycena metata TaxID=1033252 RepID=A0AAD7IRL0_9AGAR|nr:oleoyl phosphatidylcholine desaturase [Mycena metata]